MYCKKESKQRLNANVELLANEVTKCVHGLKKKWTKWNTGILSAATI